MNREYTKRLELLIGDDKQTILNNSKVLVCGCGGVGSFVAEALARSGIGKLILVDFDNVDITNLNRQLMTTKANIGQSKAEVLKKRLEEISDCKVEIKKTFIDENFIIDDVDIIADCIDTLTSKFILQKKAKERGITCISALGSAKRVKIENIQYTKLSKTKNDPLAKAFRSLVRKEKYPYDIEVVYTDSISVQKELNLKGQTTKERHPLGSSIFVVGSVGLYLAYVICEKLWEVKK